MSASKDKITRKELRDAGQDKRQLAEQKKAAEQRKTRTKYIVVAVVVVLVFAFIFIYNSAIPSRNLTAVTIDGETFSVAELNYQYSNSFQQFYNNYYDYIQYGLFFDASQSLADQMYSEDMSWRDYFIEQAVNTMKQTKALCDAGEAAGFVMDEEYEAEYDEAVASLETAWQANGYQSLKQFLNVVYGKGVDEALVKNQIRRGLYAAAYAQSVLDGYEYSADEIKSHYAEHADDFDYIGYAYYYAADEEGQDVAAEMQALADAVNGTDAETFAAKATELVEGEPTTYRMQGSSVAGNSYGEWLLDAARQPGDATMVDDGGAYYVVMFLDRDNNDYSPRDFRHILIKAADTDGDSITSAEEIQAATDKANEVYEEWQSGAATEDSFVELVAQYSEDGGSNTTGGLYTDTIKGQMVPPVNDWLFDDARQVGDTGVVEYNEAGGNYIGAHVLYYVGECEENVADALAENDLRNTAANEWLESLVGDMTVSTSNLGIAAKNR